MLSKIKWFQVAIIAAVLAIIAVAGIYFGLIDPLNKRMADAVAKYDTAQADLTKAKADLPIAQKDTIKATQEVAAANREWGVYDRQFMPRIDLSNRFTATRQYWNEMLKTLGPKVLKFLYGDRSVRVVAESIAIPAPVGDPNAVVAKLYEIPLGNVTVSGTFEQVLRHTERWNRFDRLALVDGLVLAGNSPTLTGTYNVRLYEIPHFDVVGPPIPQAGTATGTGGAPGGMPMMSGGAPQGSYPGAPQGYTGPPGAGAPIGAPSGPTGEEANGVR